MDILVHLQPYVFIACAKSVGHSKLNKWSIESTAPQTVILQCKCGMWGCTVPELNGNGFGSLQACNRVHFQGLRVAFNAWQHLPVKI